ncbi:hypothetical protein Tco_1341689 [Tanacetum coccineum]
MSSIGELTFFLRLQVKQKDDGIFISQDKYVADILKKFDFVTMKTSSTPIETNKALIKDEEAEDVDVHLYRLMIGSLMYLAASRPDIIFVVCACAWFQVTPKFSHLHAVKWIFRYLKGQSTTRGCQFLGKRDSYEKRLIQVIKIHTDHDVADLLTKAFDVSSIRDKFRNKTGSCKAKHIEYMKCVKSQTPRQAKIGWDTKIPQSGGPLEKVGDEAVHKELGDRMERAATTASSLEAEQDSGSGPRCQETILGGVDAQTRFKTTSKESNDPTSLKSSHTWKWIGQHKTNGIDRTLYKTFWQTASTSTSENGEMEITNTIDGRVKTVTEVSIRRHLKLEDSDGISTLPNIEFFEQLALIGYVSNSDILTFQKGHFSPQWRFLIHTILYCLSAKKTA